MKIKRNLYKFIGIMLLSILSIPIAGFLVFRLWTSGGWFNDMPSLDIMATSEYLYNNPPPTLSVIHYIEINPDYDGLCIVTDSELLPYDTLWSRWFLNGDRVPYDYYSFFHYDFSNSRHNCLRIYGIDEGLHLIEIQFKTSPFDSGISYQWAIKIEPTATPTPSATP